ncbi:hypothetical protein HBH56_244870 [Parastagonospora nodorum]|nr:hypothetical protein HBH56_244870 [Parastagonospora nodorum]KAH3921049.1 hypothetical protein HBH54_246670 [Parastagonospora nodorum]KAH3939546.1 hypothetical protein HBH53_234020 [Parastagonospora nodorum]KAH3959084.1 hypothetical protein HBH51_202450 [Parastagonospora nodorum]KAH3963555.1 hypothetical protein HBH52_216500 [Parastagonospora nodorum]
MAQTSVSERREECPARGNAVRPTPWPLWLTLGIFHGVRHDNDNRFASVSDVRLCADKSDHRCSGFRNEIQKIPLRSTRNGITSSPSNSTNTGHPTAATYAARNKVAMPLNPFAHSTHLGKS